MGDASDRLYSGEGVPISKRNLRLPLFEHPARLDSPEHYIAERGLRDAVNVALALGQPLIVTGDPGTGKTQLAASIAYELDLPEPLLFVAKTTSTRRRICFIATTRWRTSMIPNFGKTRRRWSRTFPTRRWGSPSCCHSTP